MAEVAIAPDYTQASHTHFISQLVLCVVRC